MMLDARSGPTFVPLKESDGSEEGLHSKNQPVQIVKEPLQNIHLTGSVNYSKMGNELRRQR